MKHLNGNILAVVDVETTGTKPRHNDIIEICILPLSHSLEPDKGVLPFNLTLQPARPENIDLEALRVQRKDMDDVVKQAIPRNTSKITDSALKGCDPDKACDLLFEWFERLHLKPNKRIMPIAHNWCFDREFIIDWLGLEGFEYIFDPRYRDLMGISLFENDVADWRAESFPYQKNTLRYLCSTLKISVPDAHTALDDCVATAKAYKSMIKHSRTFGLI